MNRRFMQLDVFAGAPLGGNPLAVVIDAEGLDDVQMVALARWTNLSETTFLLPPTDPAADYRVRIFTPTVELPFAGHPTLGSAYAWLASGRVPQQRDGQLVQQCGIGLVRLRRDAGSGRLAFAAPPRRRSGPLEPPDVERIAGWLRLPRRDIVAHEWVDNGPRWQAVMLASADAVLALQPDFGAERELELGVVGAYPAGDDAAFEVRAFFPGPSAICEDPVTGSLNAGLAQWLIGAGLAPPRYVASQGTAIGRRGRVHLERDGSGDTVWVGGDVHPRIDGTLAL